jgi:protein gp37
MAENTKIEWCDHTFNPWIGCTKVSPGCQHCYAEQLMDKRLGKVNWGPGNPRQRTSESNWKQVERWNLDAEMEEERYVEALEDPSAVVAGMPYHPKVFVASLADWLDPEVPIDWLADLLTLISRCPHLDFLMLTKRPHLWRERIEGLYRDQMAHGGHHELAGWLLHWINGNPPGNVWIGTSVENQDWADKRIPELLQIPARIRFLSCEPLLGPVDLSAFMGVAPTITGGECYTFNAGIHWVICGGESGPSARPMHPDWARSLRDQCQAASVPFFFKQWGEWLPLEQKTPVGWYKAKDYFRIRFNRINWLKGGVEEPGFDEWIKVGKAKAGRLIDGREWNDVPTTT